MAIKPKIAAKAGPMGAAPASFAASAATISSPVRSRGASASPPASRAATEASHRACPCNSIIASRHSSETLVLRRFVRSPTVFSRTVRFWLPTMPACPAPTSTATMSTGTARYQVSASPRVTYSEETAPPSTGGALPGFTTA